MATENENTVAEQPATHNKKAQRWIFIIVGVVLFFLVVDVVVKLNRGQNQVGKAKDRNEAIVNPVAPQDSEKDFQRQFKKLEESRAREGAEGEKATEPPDQALARLRAERAEQAEIASLPPAERAEALQQRADSRTAGGQRGPQKTPLEQWEEKEALRVLNSRYSSLKVQLVPAGSASATTATRSASPRSAGTQRSTATGSPISSEQNRVKAELARMDALKRKLESGEADPEDIATEMGAGFQRTAFASAAEQATEAVAPQRTAQRSAGQVVGKPAAVSSPEAGAKHISVGTVARAVLDQQVISDYDGPFRCMFIDDVYDVTNRYIMIPKGSRCTGSTARIKNVNEPIQARMGLLVNWIVLPDGSKISMDKKVALDAEGVSAIKDKVNRHFLAQFLGVAAYAIVSSETSRDGSGLGVETSFEGDVGEGLRDQFAPLARKYLDLVPTITLRPGTPMRIFFEDDIYAQPWSSVSSDVVSQVRLPNAR